MTTVGTSKSTVLNIFRGSKVLVIIGLFALVGTVALLRSHAATPAVSIEAENGAYSLPVIEIPDSTASNGKALQFNAVTNCTSAAPPAGVTAGMVLSFCDDFNGPTVDTAKWSFQSSAEQFWSSNPFGTGNYNNQQLEFDQPANCTQDQGILHMTAKRETVTALNHTYEWTSCMINTSPSYEFQYGYIEARVQFPALKGFWPALWTWAKPNTTIPGNGETDAYEYYSDNRTKLYLTQHNSGGGGCTYNLPFDPTTGMHTYGVDIQPNGTNWFVDGLLVCHVTTTSGGLTNILVDNFVYAAIPPDASTTSGEKLVDYVRAWR